MAVYPSALEDMNHYLSLGKDCKLALKDQGLPSQEFAHLSWVQRGVKSSISQKRASVLSSLGRPGVGVEVADVDKNR